MSASNAFLTPTAAYLFTDGAALDASTSRPIAFMSKVALLPQFNAAATATGNVMVVALFGSALAECEFADFDDMISKTPGVLRRYIEKIAGHVHAATFDDARIAIVGWSPKANAPALYCLQTEAGIGVKPFEMTPTTTFINPAATHETDRSILSLQFDPLRPAASGLQIMRAQRRKKFGPHHGIGGWCQMTTITRSGILTDVLERWPDKIGEHIKPSEPQATGTFMGAH